MRFEPRAVFAAAVLAALAVSSCATSLLPEGDGGWSAERRRTTIEQAARDSGTQFADPATAAATTGGPTRTLDLATALDLGRRENRRVAAAKLGLEASRSAVTRALGGFLPSTTVTGRYTWYTQEQTNQISESPMIGGVAIRPPTVTVRESKAGTVSGVVELPIDWAGELRQALVAAQAGYRSEAARVAAIGLEEQNAVVRAYFGWLEARRLLGVTDERIAQLEEQQRNAQRRFDAGRLTKNELLVVAVALADARLERYRRDLALQHERWALNRAIGAPIAAPTEVVDVESPPAAPSPAAVVAAARVHNPVLRRLLEQVQQQEARASSIARGWLPKLFAGGHAEATTADILKPRESAAGFVGFRWNLGTDLERAADHAEARHLAAEARKELEEELRALQHALGIAFSALDERLRAFAVAEGAVAQSEENLRIRRQQFDAGRATSEDVLDAEALRSGQRAALAGALYQAHVRRADLWRLMGLGPEQDLQSLAETAPAPSPAPTKETP